MFIALPQYTLVITLNMPNKLPVCDVENAPFRLIRRSKCKYKKLTLVIKSYLIYQTKCISFLEYSLPSKACQLRLYRSITTRQMSRYIIIKICWISHSCCYVNPLWYKRRWSLVHEILWKYWIGNWWLVRGIKYIFFIPIQF